MSPRKGTYAQTLTTDIEKLYVQVLTSMYVPCVVRFLFRFVVDVIRDQLRLLRKGTTRTHYMRV